MRQVTSISNPISTTILVSKDKTSINIRVDKCSQGRTAIDRAIYIGEHCDSLEVEALQWAADAIKNTTRDTNKYSACMTQLNEACKKRGLKTIEVDQAWLATTQRENEEILDSLDAELKGYKNNMIKEKIRVSCIGLEA